jgi:ATP-binding cassette subfamily B protein
MGKRLNIKKLGVSLDFTPPEPPKKHGFRESWKHLVRVLPFFKPFVKHYILLSFYSVVSAAFGLVLPFTPKILLDNGLANKDMGLITGILVFTFWMSTISMVISWINSQYSEYLGSFVSYKTQMEFINKLTRLDEEYVESQRTGDLISRAGGLEAGIGYIATTISTLMTLVVRIVAIPAAISIMDWRLALIGFPTLTVSYVSWYYIQRLLRSYQKARADAGGKLNSSMFDLVSSLSDLRMSGVTRNAVNTYKREYVKVWQMQVVANLVSSIYGFGSNLMMAVISLLVSLFGWSQVVSGAWTLGKVTTITLAFSYITSPIQTLYGLWNSLLGTSVSIQRFFEVYDAKEIERTGTVVLPEGSLEISCKDVTFTYSKGKEVLRGLNFSAAPGKVIAITGDSGCGKTTFMKNLAGLLKYKNGSITVSGVEIPQIEWDSLRSKITFLSQQPYFITGTFEQNIRFGCTKDIDYDEIIRMCRLDKVRERIGAELLGERAKGLSAGERQRVALARTIANLKPVMLLDEPLSQVDIPTVRDIFTDILPFLRQTTCIIITHNPYLLQMADETWFMYDGKLFPGLGVSDVTKSQEEK